MIIVFNQIAQHFTIAFFFFIFSTTFLEYWFSKFDKNKFRYWVKIGINEIDFLVPARVMAN